MVAKWYWYDNSSQKPRLYWIVQSSLKSELIIVFCLISKILWPTAAFNTYFNVLKVAIQLKCIFPIIKVQLQLNCKIFPPAFTTFASFFSLSLISSFVYKSIGKLTISKFKWNTTIILHTKSLSNRVIFDHSFWRHNIKTIKVHFTSS